MNFDDVMALVKAGYTKEEISAMSAPETPATVQEPETPATVQEPETPATVPEPETVPQQTNMEHLLREILGAVQAGNITKNTMEPPVENGGNLATARLINPNYGKEKK